MLIHMSFNVVYMNNLGTVIANLLHNRIGKQCRERWYNHLDPNIKKGDWTEEVLNIFF